jgi:hypothetical protein
MKLTSPRAFEVVKYLLEHKATNQFKVSSETGVAYSWTNEVINFLYDRGVVSKDWRRCELVDAAQLLEIIALERPLKNLVRASSGLEALSVREGETLLSNICEELNVEFALTVFSGLEKLYEYYITFPEVHAYVSSDKVKTFIPQGRGPVTLTLLAPDFPSIFRDRKRIEGFWVCSPAQLVIDLFCSGSGRDAAIQLLEAIQHGRL